MQEMQMGVVESRFADIIWEHEPLSSAELARYGAELLQWKKTTCYTVLKRLCDKGIFQNDRGTVTSQLSREEFYALQSEKFVEDAFDGSLPAFLTAFTARKRLTAADVEKLRRMVAEYEEGE
ncbi:MAG: BlaI/MecI/CopY family transcriptional regulator [Clostridia bacterium]|nr:BlaI/MecI/CopY family transcriptional regulator [Clostridia bacterium]